MKRLFSLLFPLYYQQKFSFLWVLVLATISSLSGILLLCISGYFLVSSALFGAMKTFNLFLPSSLVRGFSMIRIVSRYAERVFGHDFILYLLSNLRCTVFKSLMKLSTGQLRFHKIGDLTNRMCSDIEVLDNFFLSVLLPMLSAFVLVIVSFLLIIFFIPWNIAILYLLVITVVYGTLFLLLFGFPLFFKDEIQNKLADLRVSILDIIEGYSDLLLTNGIQKANQIFREKCEVLSNMRIKKAKIFSGIQFILVLTSGIGIAILLWYFLGSLEKNEISPFLMTGLLLATLGLLEISWSLGQGMSHINTAIQGADRIHNILSLEPDNSEPILPIALPKKGVIRLENVNFSYKRPAELFEISILKSINLNIEIGERILLTGPSGSGKSTLLNLLLRLQDPNSGQISFGGCDLRFCSQKQLHERIALLSQDSPIFLGSLRNNLLIGNPKADDDLLLNILELVHLDNFVYSLPKGLDSWINEMGTNLSMGQIRRLCLARALLSPATVLVLDEPTSSLDSLAEELFFSDLVNSVHDRSVVLTTHAKVPDGIAHRSYFLQNGYLHEGSYC